MNDQTFLQVQALELQRLLDNAGDDPLMRPQLRIRLEEVEKRLEELKQKQGSLWLRESNLPRAAIFLRGGDVHGSEGIRPSLAGEALIQYEKMFTEQALHDEREAARQAGRQRRPRGALMPRLLFTGTPRGSFGLQFVPETADDGPLRDVHAAALHHVADALVAVADSESQSLGTAVERIPPRVLQPLQQFLKTLAQHGVELRLAFSDRSTQTVSPDKVKSAAERLEREVSQETFDCTGIFRGVTRESGYFDLNLDDGHTITGTVADNLTEDDLERIDALTNKRCHAMLQKTTVRTVGGSATPSYLLLDAREAQ
jgi:hypothetical protein